MNERYFARNENPRFVEPKLSKKERKRQAAIAEKIVDYSDDGDFSRDSKFIVFLMLILQFALALGSYSGENKPPMYGDFEAQRHWMEITYHLPPYLWYVNSTLNDLQYWGLDYPPLTAYHHHFMGAIAHYINPKWIELFHSRGFESSGLKLFMRLSAIIPLFLFYVPPILHYFRQHDKAKKSAATSFLLILAITYPAIIVIDNGHFQYNSISLGFFLIAYCFLTSQKLILGSIFFVFALNYKQMELYHSLPVFFYILARCIRHPLSENLIPSFLRILGVGAVVLFTFIVLWLPFIVTDTALDVLIRVFPFNRGIYEDKVASVWCAFSFIFKRLPIKQDLIFLSTVGVLLFSIPSLYFLFQRSTPKNFRLSLFATSLSFFLFSFHVHEKTILLVGAPAILLLTDYPKDIVWFLDISCVSLFSLCIKDENLIVFMLFVAYFLTSIFFWNVYDPDSLVGNVLRTISISIGLLICVFELVAPVPQRYPHIYQLANALYSCIHFLYFLFLFTYRMWDQQSSSTSYSKKKND